MQHACWRLPSEFLNPALLLRPAVHGALLPDASLCLHIAHAVAAAAAHAGGVRIVVCKNIIQEAALEIHFRHHQGADCSN